MTRDAQPLRCPPAAMLVPVDVQMFGFGALVAVADVWSVRLSAN
jgi:hypothetical protein